jgi:hypothetical protein
MFSYRVAIKGQSSVAAGFSLRLHRLESLCHHLTATWYQIFTFFPFSLLPLKTEGPLPPPSNSLLEPHNSGAQASSLCNTGKMPVLPDKKFGGEDGGATTSPNVRQSRPDEL